MSALKENEIWLDSISGKVSQFNNAMQAMWSNTLDSDMVKGFVSLGTEIIKIIDKVGLLNTALVALATYSMIKNKMGPIAFLGGISDIIRDVVGKVGGFIGSLTGMTAATSAYTAETLAASVANGALTATEATNIATKNGLTLATTNLTAAEATEMLMKSGISQADALEMVSKLGLTKETQALTLAKIQDAIASGTLTKAQGAQIASALGLSVANKGLAASFGALWTAIWPILAVMVGVAVIWGAVKLIDHLVVTTEELTEELNELKTELADVQSELESVNSELATTEDRMAELLAKDSLTFTEEEELDRLQKENAELQRKLDLLKQEEEYTQEKTARKLNETMDSAMADQYKANGEKRTWLDDLVDSAGEAITAAFGGIVQPRNSHRLDSLLNWKIKSYKTYATQLAEIEQQIIDAGGAHTDEGKKLSEEKQRIETQMGEIRSFVQTKTGEFSSQIEGLDYFTGDNLEDWQIKSNKYLDTINSLQDRWAMAQGGTNAKTNAITRIFNKEEYAEASDTIDDLVKKLAKDPTNKTVLDKISEQCKLAEKDLLAVGLSVEEAVGHFTKLGQEANFATLEGKIKDISTGSAAMTKLLSDLKDGNTDISAIFDEEGKVIQTALSEMFQGTSDQTRADATRVLESAYEGIADGLNEGKIENLVGKFGLKLSASLLNIKETLAAESNLEFFPNLKEEIEGIVDTFDELSSAVNSIVDSMDLLEKARAEEAYSGSISLETMMKLMEYTDDYSKIMKIDEYGAITLVAGAEEVLVEEKLARIKSDAELALQSAEVAYQDALTAEQEAIHAEQTVNVSSPAQEWYRDRLGDLASMTAYVGSLWNSITSGNIDGMFDRASAAAEQAKLDKAASYEEEKVEVSAAVKAARTNSEELKKKRDEAEDRNEWVQGLTAENLKTKTKSDDASGGNDTVKDAEDDAFQREMDFWENRLSANQARADRLQNTIDLLEQKGMKASAQYYRDQMTLLNSVDPNDGVDSKLELLRGKLAAVTTRLGQVTKGSEEWWEAAQEYNDIVNEIQEIESAIVDMQDAIGEIDTYKFEEFNSRLDKLASKLGTIRDLIAPDGEEDWFDDEGNWTEKGVAVLGTYTQELETYKKGLAETEEAISAFGKIGGGAKWSELTEEQKKAYADQFGIHSEQEYYDKQEDLIDQQYDYMSSISDTKQSIVDMYESSIDAVEEYTESLIVSYIDYIDSVRDALDAEKDLFDFKRKIQDQSSDIAETERKIAALSGSTNAADIAERRRLEATLADQKRDLDDSYREHSLSSQQDALDSEAQAYEETMTKFIEGLRTSLDQATMDMETFLGKVSTIVSLNAGVILTEYQNTGLELDPALTTPWVNAKNAVGDYSGDALDLLNKLTQGGFFSTFPETIGDSLESPWTVGSSAATAFGKDVGSVMQGVVDNIATNVQEASKELSTLYEEIQDYNKMVDSVDLTPGDTTPPQENPTPTPTPTPTTTVKLKSAGANGVSLTIQDSNLNSRTETINGVKYVKAQDGYYYKKDRLIKSGKVWTIIPGTPRWMKESTGSATTGTGGGSGKGFTMAAFAKGTTGVSKNQLAIVDELGPELMLRANPETGRLDYVTAGTGIVPADLTKNLMEWGQFTPDALNLGGGVNVNMINNAVNKPEFNFAFDALVKAENITEETLPAVKKLVTQELNRFTKELNYALKGKGAR